MISRPLNETPEERDELASEYVLGTLPAELRVQVRLRLEDDAELRTAVDSWERRLLGLTDLVEPVLPSTQLWPRIERSVQVLEPKPRSPAPRAPSWWNLLPLWRGLAGAGLAASLLFGALLLTQTTAKPTYLVVLVGPQDKAPGWVVQASNPRELQLIPLGWLKFQPTRRWNSGPRLTVGKDRYPWVWSNRGKPCRCRWISCHHWSRINCSS